jgi:adenosine kinase
VRIYPDEFTATYTVITDLDQNQIAGFHSGAMCRARELSFRGLNPSDIDLVIISPNDPEGMLQYTDECRELGIRFIFDPSQQLARLDGRQVLEGMAGAYVLAVNVMSWDDQAEDGLDEAEI